MGYNLGVDLGTTFTAAAVNRGGRIDMMTLGDRTVVTPSVVFVREDGQVVTGDAAARRAVGNPHRIGREFKRRLGDPTPLMLGGSPHSAIALLGYLLRDVVHKVSDAEGAPPDRVVLTHPANWGPYRRELFDEVPRLAGLDAARTITEPEAAAAYYVVERDLADNDVVAVYDLGGGTFDATVVRKRSQGIEILGSPEGIERLGGVDFDEAVMAHVDYALDGALGELDPRDQQAATALRQLRQDCVEAKETLSVDTETIIPVFLPQHHGEVRLTRAEFEEMVRAPVESTIEALRRALRSARVEPADLAAVVLIGGSSRIPLVAQMVSSELGRPTAVDTHPKYAVALGAATLAADESLPVATGSGQVAGAGGPGSAHPGGAAAGLALAGVATTAATGLGPPSLAGDRVATGAERASTDGDRASAGPGVADGGLGSASSGGGGGSSGGGGGSSGGAPAGAPPPPLAKSPSTTGDPGGNGAIRRRNAVLLAGVAFLAVVGVLLALGVVNLGAKTAAPPTQLSPVGAAPAGPPSTAAPPTTTPLPVSLATPTVTGSIGVAGPHGIAVSPDGTRTYVTSVGASRLSTIDTASGAVLSSIFLPQPPQFVAVTPDGRHAYVSCFETNGPGNVVAVLDTSTNAVVANIPVGQHPFALAVTPDGRQVYVPDHNSSAISVIDTRTNSVTATIQVKPNPHSVAFTPDSRTAYVADHESDLVSVIDTATRAVTATIPVPKSPHSAAVSADGKRAIAASYDANSASVIDTATNKVTVTIRVGSNPQSVAFAPDGQHAYVVNDVSNNVSVIDLNTSQVTATVPVGNAPIAVALTPDGRRAYVTNSESNTVSVLTTAS